MSPAFQRARTPAQRAERAASILEAARRLMGEMPVGAITLNALAQGSGLAPSNVLSYYDSREGVLLALVIEETEAWLTDLDLEPDGVAESSAEARCAVTSRRLAAAFERHPQFCELISVQSAVLERNVEVTTVVEFKRKSGAQLGRFTDQLLDALPELRGLGRSAVLDIAARSVLIAGALWAQSRSSEVIAQTLVSDQADAPAPFTEAIERTLLYLLTGAASLAGPGRATVL